MPSLGDRRVVGGEAQVYVPGAGWIADTSTGQPAPPAPSQPPPGTRPSLPSPPAPQVPAIQESQGRFARREAILSRDTAAPLAPPAAPLSFLGPGAAQAARFQNIAPSAIIPPVQVQSPLVQALASAPYTFGLQAAPPPVTAASRSRASRPALPAEQVTAAPRVTQTGTAGTGLDHERLLLNLAATDPERLRERARFVNISRDRGAQVDAGVALTAESMARGLFPDVMTDAVASRLANLYGYGSLEEMMSDLGYLPNPDAPGTWLRREAVSPGAFGTRGFNGSGSGGGGGGRGTIVRGAVPRATRGGGFSRGLVSWRI